MDFTWCFGLIFLLTFFEVLYCDAESDLNHPTWKEVFKTNTNWEGQYVYKNRSFGCNLYVHSVDSEENGFMISTFSDGNVSVELHGRSNDGVTVFLSKFTSWRTHSSDIFPEDQDLRIVGHLEMMSKEWMFVGEFERPATDLYSIYFIPEDTKLTPHHVRVPWKEALPLALSLSVALIGLAVMIGMVIWARKKGYLRHVPLSYKPFQNDREGNETVNYNGASETVHI